MLSLILILNILNICGLTAAGILYFKEKYTIVSIEQWNEVATVYNALAEKNLLDCIDDITPNQEACGGHGFFKDYIEEYLDEEGDSSAKRKYSSAKHKEK